MTKHRTLNIATLDMAAQAWVGNWYMPTVWSKTMKDKTSMRSAIGGREWIIQSFYNASFKDEFEYLYPRFLAELGPTAKKDFLSSTGDFFTKRNDAEFEEILAKNQAINPAGEHIKGMIGLDVVGQYTAGMHTVEVETPQSLSYRRRMKLDRSHRKTYLKVVPNRIDVHCGEVEEHGHKSLAAFIRDDAGMAAVMNIGNADAILGLDALLNSVDAGAGAATIAIQTTTQPVDPDAAVAGVPAAKLVMADPAFLGASDQSDGSVDAAADTIADSTTETKTQTAGYFVVGSTTTPPTHIDQHISGNVATSGADMNFNTVAFVDGATVSVTSYVVTMSQGSTAN